MQDKDKKYHHGDLRNSLIEAGIELINREGAGKLSLRKVAALCGVSQAAPYSHFQSKEDLLHAMQDHVIQQFMASLENTIQDCNDQHDPRLLVQLGKNYVLFFIEHPQYFTFIFSQALIVINLALDDDDADNFPPFQLFKTKAVPIMTDLGMTEAQTEDAIIAMWATVHGLAAIATMKNVHYNKDWAAKIEDIIWNKDGSESLVAAEEKDRK
jgi:AcrR family transcriptional regulator